nr:hypothetical protein Iba_chr15aCG15170 [Ipomoea batatas]
MLIRDLRPHFFRVDSRASPELQARRIFLPRHPPKLVADLEQFQTRKILAELNIASSPNCFPDMSLECLNGFRSVPITAAHPRARQYTDRRRAVYLLL